MGWWNSFTCASWGPGEPASVLSPPPALGLPDALPSPPAPTLPLSSVLEQAAAAHANANELTRSAELRRRSTLRIIFGHLRKSGSDHLAPSPWTWSGTRVH